MSFSLTVDTQCGGQALKIENLYFSTYTIYSGTEDLHMLECIYNRIKFGCFDLANRRNFCIDFISQMGPWPTISVFYRKKPLVVTIKDEI